MDGSGGAIATMAGQDERIAEAFAREHGRVRRFIGSYVPDRHDAEDLLQQVFFEFVEAARLLAPIEQAGAWLLRVARNRIVDRFRRKAVRGTTLGSTTVVAGDDGEEPLSLAELLPAGDSPEGALARELLVEELAAALDDLPEAQRAVFVAHELEGRSFADLAAESGEPINTLLSRKHYAVKRLRARLQDLRDEFDEL